MQEQDHQSLAAEVIEMGEQLFAFALEERQENSQPAFPLAEIEAASHEFFTALRLLLTID